MPFVIKQYRFGSYNASVSVSLYPISVSNRIIFTVAKDAMPIYTSDGVLSGLLSVHCEDIRLIVQHNPILVILVARWHSFLYSPGESCLLIYNIKLCFQGPHAASFGVPKSDCIIRSKCLYNFIQYLIHLYSLSSYFSHLQTW